MIELALRVQERSGKKYATAPNDLVRDALFVLTHDSICVHRAIGTVVDAGWSGPGAALLRALVDLNVSTLAIVNSANPPMAAFRYMHSGLRRHARDQLFTAQQRKAIFSRIRKRIALLRPELKTEALAVVRERDRPYWFAEEFQSPTVVLDRFGVPGMKWAYLQISAAAHGSMIGLRLFRDEPDRIDINPYPVGPKALALDVSSCRFLAGVLELRDAHERLGMAAEIAELVRPIRDAGMQLADIAAI
jgi:hypothetical protein